MTPYPTGDPLADGQQAALPPKRTVAGARRPTGGGDGVLPPGAGVAMG